MKKIFVVLFLGLVVFAGCGSSRENTISIAGSSTVYPITLEAQDAFKEEDPNALISVESTGTGGGFELFTKGETQINNASRAIKDEEIQAAKDNEINYEEFMIGTDGITVIINNNNDFATELSKEDLRKAFESGSEVETWSDINPDYPDEEISFYGPTSASGTYDFFVEEILEDEDGALRSDMNGTENDNEIVSNIEKDEYGIGFLGYSYYANNKDNIQEVAIDGIAPEYENIKSGEYILSRPLFIYVNTDAMEENETLKNFVNYYIENSQNFVEKAGYVALTDEEQTKLEEQLN